MTVNLKIYYDAAVEAESNVRRIAAEIDSLFNSGKRNDAIALREDLETAKADAKSANDLYISMRASGEQDPIPAHVAIVKDGDLNVGMSDKEIKSYSILRLIRAQVENTPQIASLEMEASRAVAKMLGKEPEGHFIPWDVLSSPRPKATQTVGDPSTGGYMVETSLLSESFIDTLRNRMLCQAAGARVMTGLVGDVEIPKKTASSTLYWVGEGNAPSESTLTFGQAAARPKTAACYSQLTRKFIKQSSLDAEMLVRDDLAASVAVGADYVGLHGAGSGNEPQGIAGTTGIGSVAGGTNGLAPTWDHITQLEREVAIDNADIGALGYMTNPKVRYKLKNTYRNATYGEIPIWGDNPTQSLNGYAAWVTNQVSSTLTKGTSSGVCSAIFFGNWSDLLFLFWGGLDIIVDPYTNSTSGTVVITAMQDIDVIVRREESFAAMLDALTA